jgi:hypothetical protein
MSGFVWSGTKVAFAPGNKTKTNTGVLHSVQDDSFKKNCWYLNEALPSGEGMVFDIL